MQCCLNDMVINDKTKFLVKNLMVSDHSVIIPLDDDITSFLHILLKLQGVTDCFPLQSLTLSEYERDNVQKYHITAEAPSWDPRLSSLSSQKDIVWLILGDLLSSLSQQHGANHDACECCGQLFGCRLLCCWCHWWPELCYMTSILCTDFPD